MKHTKSSLAMALFMLSAMSGAYADHSYQLFSADRNSDGRLRPPSRAQSFASTELELTCSDGKAPQATLSSSAKGSSPFFVQSFISLTNSAVNNGSAAVNLCENAQPVSKRTEGSPCNGGYVAATDSFTLVNPIDISSNLKQGSQMLTFNLMGYQVMQGSSDIWLTTNCTSSTKRVTLCHKPGTAAEQTLEVAQSAVSGHMGHGDKEGACPASDSKK